VIDIQIKLLLCFFRWPAPRQMGVGSLVGVRGGAAVGEQTDTCVWDVAARQTSLLCMSASAGVGQFSSCGTV
jgi:hypothetical protein